jgi:hypothetical protein
MSGPVLGVAKSKSVHVGAPQIVTNSRSVAGYVAVHVVNDYAAQRAL